ncbi:MAG: efflux RND transporter periplasmic adaptor subunit [Anaerolineaceae bacterium]
MKQKLLRLFGKGKQLYQEHPKPVLIGGGALGLVIILLVVLSLTSSKKVPAPTTQTVALARGDLTQTIEIVGTVRAVPSASLTWSTSGIVMPYTIKVGDTVKAGEPILELEPSSVASSILRAQTNLITAKNDLAGLIAADTDFQTAAQTLADAEYTYNEARADFAALIEVESATIETVEPLIEKFYDTREALWVAKDNYLVAEPLDEKNQKRIDAISALDEDQRAYNKSIDTILTIGGFYFGTDFGSSTESKYQTYRTAKAALNEARAAWNAARDNSDEISAAAAKVQALENTINGAGIIAPFDGTVTDILVSGGDDVSNGDTAIQLDNLSNLVVDVSVSEVDVNHIDVGDSVTVAFDAITNRVYNGVVTQVGNSGIESSGVVKFNVSITIQDADEQIRPGFTTVNTIVVDQATNAVLIPLAAINTVNNEKMVIVMRKGIPTTVAIKLGARSDTYGALVSGELQAGDLVVISTTAIQ